jgi:hypothetical protein
MILPPPCEPVKFQVLRLRQVPGRAFCHVVTSAILKHIWLSNPCRGILQETQGILLAGLFSINFTLWH